MFYMFISSRKTELTRGVRGGRSPTEFILPTSAKKSPYRYQFLSIFFLYLELKKVLKSEKIPKILIFLNF